MEIIISLLLGFGALLLIIYIVNTVRNKEIGKRNKIVKDKKKVGTCNQGVSLDDNEELTFISPNDLGMY